MPATHASLRVAALPRALGLALLAAGAVLAAGAPVAAQAQVAPFPQANGAVAVATPAPAAQRHTLNLTAADIGVLIQTVSEITGRGFIVDPRVEGRVTVISSQAMDAEQVWDTFTAVLRTHGYAVVPNGGLWKVLPLQDAIQEGAAANAGGPDAVVTRVIEVRQVPAMQLAELLRPLVPAGAQVAAQGSTLVVTDRAGNVERLARLVERIDTAGAGEVEVLPLRHANAAEVARTLAQLEPGLAAAQAPGALAAGGPRLVADTRSNSVLLSGDRAQRLRLRTLVAHLDTPLGEGDATQVIYLRYAQAEDVVPVLQEVAATLTGTSASGEGARTASIGFHAETNALVIAAPPAVFRELASVVRQLDIRRAQVLVEAVIVEVSDDLADELGVQWQTTDIDGPGDSGVIGGTNFPDNSGGGSIVGGLTNPLGAISGNGLRLGYLGGSISLPIGPDGSDVTVFQVGALVRALRGDGRANILSRPSVITLDHQEAEFKVAQEVPFLTGQYTNAGGGDGNQPTNPFQTIERKDVGLILNVTPHVNEGDSVRLDIRQEVSTLAPSQVQGAVDLITNTREIRTSVMVPDGGFLVLGGLTSEEVGEAISGVPGLSRVPVLGNLFKSRRSTRAKRNLMIFLRPYILRDGVSEAAVTGERYTYLRAEQIQANERFDGRVRGGELPVLPSDPSALFPEPAPATAAPPETLPAPAREREPR